MTRFRLIRYISGQVVFLVVGLSLSIPPVQAEGFKLASFSFEQVPSAEINLSSIEGGELQTTASTNTTKLAIPLKLDGERRVLLNFITFRVLHQTYSNIDSAGIAFLPADLYTIKYGLVLHQVLSEKWSLNVLVQPGLLTDFNNVSSGDITLRGGFIFEKKVSDRFTYAIGGGYSDDYGKEQILPVGRIKWSPNPNWEVDLDFPQKIDLSRKLSKKIWLGLSGKVTGGHYRIGAQTPFRTGSAQRVNRVKYSIVNVGPSVNWQTSSSFQLILNVGTSVYRRYEVFDENGDQLIDANYESSLFAKVSINFLVGR